MRRNRWTIAFAVTTAVLTTSARAGEKITLVGLWTRHIDGADPLPFLVPRSFEPIGGVARYIRKFTLEREISDNVALLHFDGVVGHATVFLNSVPLGEHGSFTPFWFEVSNILHAPGVENELIVVLDDKLDPSTIPYEEIPWVNYSGITREVYLKFSHRAAIQSTHLQYTFGPQYASVEGELAVELAGKPGELVAFSGGVLEGPPGDWGNVVLFAADAPVTLDASGRGKTTLRFSLATPRLWSPEDPYLYYLWVVAIVGGVPVDETAVPIGFRDIAVHRQDILLNGRPVFLKGICRHDIYELTGFAGSSEEMEHDMVRIKQMGANFVRLIHYPHHPRILELADQLGLMVSGEIPAWANVFDEAVRRKLYTLYEEMILRDMNHPSVILWISGNARARPMPYAAEAQQLAKSLDRNRLASYVIDNDEYDPAAVNADVRFIREAKLDVYLKITFWLYYLEFLQDAWTNFPKDIPIVIAELGFEGNDRVPLIVTPEGDQFFVKETQQASVLSERLEGWRPHLPHYADEHITGMAIYNWQDMDWPDITRYLPNHIPSLRFGLVYEDREEKQVLETVSNFFTTLPTTFVGGVKPSDLEVEERFEDAKNLSPTVNTINRDSGPSISSSGNRIYFASDGPDYVSLPKLMVTELIDGVWQPPQLLDIPQETEYYAFRSSPCISYDERTLFFTRAFLNGIFIAQTRIWSSQFINGRWQQPVDMGDVINDPDVIVATSNPSISADGDTLYFSSDRPGGYGGTDLWVSQRLDGVWQAPNNLGETVNSQHNDAEPSISTDGNTLYFTSGRPGGVGSSDIWVTHRVSAPTPLSVGATDHEASWTSPKNLGPRVNSTGSDREPEISKDGNFLYFTGIRSGGSGLSDIWFAPIPGAVDPSDLSATLTLEVASNHPGLIVWVSPADIAHQADGVADPLLLRRFRPGTHVTLKVASVFNGIDFLRWTIQGETQPDGTAELALDIDEPVSAMVEYAIPQSVEITGSDLLLLTGVTSSASRETYAATVSFYGGSTQTVRSGIEWSVDDERVATIDPLTGVLTPLPMNGRAEVTIFAKVRLAGFELPLASKRLQLDGLVISDGDLQTDQRRRSFCGALGMTSMFLLLAGRFLLSLVAPSRQRTKSWLLGGKIRGR